MCRLRVRLSLVLVVLISILWVSQIFWFDLLSEINTTFKKYYDEWPSVQYLESRYEPLFSKDPFWDNIKNWETIAMQIKIAWVNRVEKALSDMWCGNVLPKKQIWWILYYFVPEFRMDIARSLKMNQWDYDSYKYMLTDDEIEKYCNTYFTKCENVKKDKSESSTSPTYNGIMPNCKDFFQSYYNQGVADAKKNQNLELAVAWNDKYWNSSTDDSPYDIMLDLWVLWRLLFEDFQPAIKPVFYNLPIFSNSKKSLKSLKEAEENWTKGISSYDGAREKKGKDSDLSQWWVDSNNENYVNAWESNNSASIIPLWSSEPLIIETIDELREWLGSYGMTKNGSLFQWRMCEENEYPEPEQEVKVKSIASDILSDWNGDTSALDDNQNQEIIDYMKEAVDSYTDLSEQQKKNIEELVKNTIKDEDSIDTEWLEDQANSIKKCREWCEWLRVDQKASCMLMCTCWDWNAPIFDPKKNPWLWPIFRIRFCTVPAVDMKFSVWWTNMISVEKWVNEIYAAMDKLSREWKLWIWTQQHNFLDSTTKKMNVADTFAFSIDVEIVDIAQNFDNYTEYYRDYLAKNENKKLMQTYGVQNSLDITSWKNRFSVVNTSQNVGNDYRASINADSVSQDMKNLLKSMEYVVDQSKNANASLYTQISLWLSKWTDQQASFWEQVLKYVQDADKYAEVLYSKKSSKSS